MGRQLNVYLHGQKTGVLSEDQLGYLSFQYETDAQFPLSVRMPIRSEIYDRFYTEPFFDNLTPEGEALVVVAQKFHISQDNIFSILDKIGGDCAGAVSLYEDNLLVNIDSPLYNIDEDDIARIIDELPDNPLLTGMENAPRLSLAGAQSKFAVCKIDGKYYRSDDNFPTTHIIKIANKRYPHLLENELFCMKLAKKILGTVGVELREAKGRKYLEIERYDRQIKEGDILRIHQEDFCQVLGIPARRKYQQDGGPKIRDCYNAIIEFSSQAPADANKFVELIVFNYLIGNTDAHAKNFSILHQDGDIVLSPAYDLLSAEIYSEKVISREIAMIINGKGKYDSIGKKDFLALYEQLGQNPTNMARLAQNKFAKIIPTAESVRDVLNSDSLTKSGIYDSIIDIIKRRMTKLFENTMKFPVLVFVVICLACMSGCREKSLSPVTVLSEPELVEAEEESVQEEVTEAEPEPEPESQTSARVIIGYEKSRSLSELGARLPAIGVNVAEINPVNYQTASPAVLQQMGMERYLIAFISAERLYKAGDWDNAIAEYSNSINLKRDNPDALAARGSAWLKKSEYLRAIDDFSRALNYQNSRAELYNYRGYAYAEQGNADKAIDDYSRAIRLKPDYADALANRALALYHRGDYDTVIEDCTRLIRLEPKNATIWNRRGSAWYNKKDDERAIADFSEAIKINPNYALAYQNRGNAWHSKGEMDKALTDMNRALSLNPSLASAYTSRGNILRLLGRHESADADFATAAKLKK